MKLLNILLLSACLAGCGLAGLVASGGCAGTPNRVTYQAAATTRVTVQEAMKLWDQWVKAGRATLQQESAVKAAYEKTQAAALVLCDAGKALSSIPPGATTAQALTAAFEQAASDYTNDKTDLLALLTTLGINLP